MTAARGGSYHPTGKGKSVVIVPGVAIAWSLWLRPQTPAPDQPRTFPAAVEMVMVDVAVVDRRGQPVAGLAAADFSVFENGRAQEVSSFEAVSLGDQAATPEGATAQAPAHGRTFVLFFDDYHLSPGQASRAREALAALIRAATPADRLALAAPRAQLWMIETMPQGKEAMLERVASLQGRDYPGGLVETEMRYRDSMSVDAIEECLRAVAAEPGRKALFVLSAGLPYNSPVLSGDARCKDCGAAYPNHRRLVEASRRSNAAIYFADARGIAAAGGLDGAPHRGFSLAAQAEGSALLDGVATDSGGFTLRNFNDLRSAVVRVANESRAYYWLGYYPSDARRDGRFRKIEVRVKGKDLRVRARRGYYAPLAERER